MKIGANSLLLTPYNKILLIDIYEKLKRNKFSLYERSKYHILTKNGYDIIKSIEPVYNYKSRILILESGEKIVLDKELLTLKKKDEYGGTSWMKVKHLRSTSWLSTFDGIYEGFTKIREVKNIDYTLLDVVLEKEKEMIINNIIIKEAMD